MEVADMSPKELGEWGEDIAVGFMERRGFDVLERNWKSFSGEVDVIGKQGFVHVLVEVKTRRSPEGSFPELAVDEYKQRKYGKLAEEYLATLGRTVTIRFDVISIAVVDHERAYLRHITNAFPIDS